MLPNLSQLVQPSAQLLDATHHNPTIDTVFERWGVSGEQPVALKSTAKVKPTLRDGSCFYHCIVGLISNSEWLGLKHDNFKDVQRLRSGIATHFWATRNNYKDGEWKQHYLKWDGEQDFDSSALEYFNYIKTKR